MSTIASFKSTENRHDAYKGKDCIKVLGTKRAHNEDNQF